MSTTPTAVRQPLPERTLHAVDESSAISICCHENEVPSFVSAELARLYGSLYSSLAHLRTSGKLSNASTFVVRNAGEIVTVLLFRCSKGRVEVLNEVIRIEDHDIRRFASYVFTKFNTAQVISFRAIQSDFDGLPFFYQRFNYLEDYVANLPAGADDFTAMLGKKTRNNMRRCLKRIKEDFSSFSYRVHSGDAVDEQLVRDIFRLRSTRVAARNTKPAVDDTEIRTLLNLVRECGLVGVATIDGRVCAGAITCRTGPNYFLRILAHDPMYNKYSLGRLCCYLTISDCIVRGAREFHFLWGRSDYKTSFLGVRRDLDYLAIYRSRTQFFLNGGLALKAWCRWSKRQAMLWLLDPERQDTMTSRLAAWILGCAKSLMNLKIKFYGITYPLIFFETTDWVVDFVL